MTKSPSFNDFKNLAGRGQHTLWNDPVGLRKLAHAAVHDFRSPLRNTKSLLQFLREDHGGDLPEDAIELLVGVDEQLGKARELVNGLAEFADVVLQDYYFETVSVSQLAEGALHSFRSEVRDAEAEVFAENLCGNVVCDIKRAQQMLGHILQNAVQFRSSERPLHVSIRIADDGSALWIEDNGVGFDNKWCDTIFEPFQRLESTPLSGNGLGLSICKAICGLHGWKIEADGQIGAGSRISVLFS